MAEPTVYDRKEELRDYSTCELVEELRKRAGVEEIVVHPYVGYHLHVNADGDTPSTTKEDTGPASIFIVTD